MSYEALVREAVALYQLGASDQAVRRLREATRLAPDRVEAWQSLGVVLDAIGHTEAALAAFRRAIASAPDHYDAWYNLAFITGQHDPVAGVARFREFLARWPDDPGGQHNLACLLRDTDQLDESLATFARAVALREDVPALHFNLGQLHERRGAPDAARAAYQRALALDPGLTLARDALEAL